MPTIAERIDTLGKRLEMAIKNRGGVKQFAERAKLNRQTVYNSFEGLPSAKVLIAFAEIFPDYPMDFIFRGTPGPPPSAFSGDPADIGLPSDFEGRVTSTPEFVAAVVARDGARRENADRLIERVETLLDEFADDPVFRASVGSFIEGLAQSARSARSRNHE